MNKKFLFIIFAFSVFSGLKAQALLEISGSIETLRSYPAKDVAVDLLDEQGNLIRIDSTDRDGIYAFRELEPNTVYYVRPRYKASVYNGVSTMDIVLTRKYLQGERDLETPYAFIGADMDGSDTITAHDLLVMTKVVLGEVDFLEGKLQFIRKDWVFNPDFSSFHNISKAGWKRVELNSDSQVVDFFLTRRGDVNSTLVVE